MRLDVCVMRVCSALSFAADTMEGGGLDASAITGDVSVRLQRHHVMSGHSGDEADNDALDLM